ncbi:MAG TPA: SDR family NAD(P)-dependent oxidoreductase [Casimicrobiaceae bacterium]|jgi:NAD(P)-dependent dehydrogenase (short-subunit alcohol dehydrogenase family)|nr:SDR family NAD(P)-dependent oxidoreductase [Casimicrobiaceae bacterium]
MHAAIVTGVSRGLGAALAAALLERDFAVLGVSRASHPRLSGERYRFVPFDLTNAARVDEILGPAFSALADTKPASACLLNNAATAGPVGTLGRLAAGEIASSIAVNLAAVVTLTNLFCRVFADPALPRRVINVSSGAAQTALAGESVYCAAKAGMEMLTKALAVEQQAPGFRAITVRPGVIDTEMQAFARSQSRDVLPSVDLFLGFHRDGRLVAPEVVAAKIVGKLVEADVEHGRTYNYQEL